MILIIIFALFESDSRLIIIKDNSTNAWAHSVTYGEVSLGATAKVFAKIYEMHDAAKDIVKSKKITR